MCKAHDALAIVFLMHKGKLESFEQDTRGRLLLAALAIHRPGLAYIEPVGQWDSTRPAIEKMRKLVPELVPEKAMTCTLECKYWNGYVFGTFRRAILDELRNSTFERFGQAEGHIRSYYDTIRDDNTMHYQPIRLDLVKRLQRLVPELGYAAKEINDQNSTRILHEIELALFDRVRDKGGRDRPRRT
jgi:hypothetical protein